MSPAHFARLFTQATGLAPHQYVILCRIAGAKQLLAETDVPLVEIGPRVGFTDQNHFTALFRKHVATTPKNIEIIEKSSCCGGAPPLVRLSGDVLRSPVFPPVPLRRPTQAPHGSLRDRLTSSGWCLRVVSPGVVARWG